MFRIWGGGFRLLIRGECGALGKEIALFRVQSVHDLWLNAKPETPIPKPKTLIPKPKP